MSAEVTVRGGDVVRAELSWVGVAVILEIQGPRGGSRRGVRMTADEAREIAGGLIAAASQADADA